MVNGKDSKKEFFDILGLKEDADKDGIKKAYRKLAKKNHPDINKDDPDANKKFMKIQDAYDELLTQAQNLHKKDLHKPKYSNSKNSFFDSFFSKSIRTISIFFSRKIRYPLSIREHKR